MDCSVCVVAFVYCLFDLLLGGVFAVKVGGFCIYSVCCLYGFLVFLGLVGGWCCVLFLFGFDCLLVCLL